MAAGAVYSAIMGILYMTTLWSFYNVADTWFLFGKILVAIAGSFLGSLINRELSHNYTKDRRLWCLRPNSRHFASWTITSATSVFVLIAFIMGTLYDFFGNSGVMEYILSPIMFFVGVMYTIFIMYTKLSLEVAHPKYKKDNVAKTIVSGFIWQGIVLSLVQIATFLCFLIRLYGWPLAGTYGAPVPPGWLIRYDDFYVWLIAVGILALITLVVAIVANVQHIRTFGFATTATKFLTGQTRKSKHRDYDVYDDDDDGIVESDSMLG